MKKFFITMFTAIFTIIATMTTITSCKCSSDKQDEEVVPAELNVENLISADKEAMFVNYGSDYRWLETTVVYDNYLDADTVLSVAVVTNIFEAIDEKEEGYDAFVWQFTHTSDNNDVQYVHDFYVGNFPLLENEVILTFDEAFDNLMKSNIVKPHSHYVVLRKEVGPVAANPQYIFGNVHEQVYVDAKSGNVSAYNPVFPKNGQPDNSVRW